jgi:hypothetical protein
MQEKIVPWALKAKIQEIPLSPLAVFLPRDLTLKSVLHPTNKAFTSLQNQAWYFICTGNGGVFIFLLLHVGDI